MSGAGGGGHSCIYHHFQGWEICLTYKIIFPNYHGFWFCFTQNIYFEIPKNRGYIGF